jgi:hypothetical protein
MNRAETFKQQSRGLGLAWAALFFSVLVISLNACGQVFTIKAGTNTAKPIKFSPHFGLSSMTYLAEFDSSCLYFFNTKDSADINKLFGWSSGFGAHSLRIGWNCKSQKGLDLWAYIHYAGKRWPIPRDSSSNVKGSAALVGAGFAPGLPIACGIYRARDGIEFEAIQGPRREKVKILFYEFPGGPGLYQWPYFGGTSKAPHEMKIKLSPRYD